MKKEGGVIVDLPSIGVVGREQDGAKHYMMCDDCEQHLGDAENHMLRVGRHLRLGQDQPYDPELLARAALGLALKCHRSRAPEYRQFVLNKRQVATLRRWILEGYQRSRVRLVPALWLDDEDLPGVDPQAMGYAELQLRKNGYLADFLIDGLSWSLIVDTNDRDLALAGRYDVLRERDEAEAMVGGIGEHRYFSAIAEARRALPAGAEQPPPDEPDPERGRV